MKFCPRCGATDKDFYKGFCTDCYAQMNAFAEFPNKIKLTQCKKCDFWLSRNSWIQDSYQNLVKLISEKIETKLFEPEFSVDLRENVATVKLSGYADERKRIPIEIKKEVFIDFESRKCPSCTKLSGKNYELKIQLRRLPNSNILKYKKLADFIKKDANFLRRKDERARSFWIEDNKEGPDFFFGFKQIGDSVLHEILDNFKTKHEMSSEFVGIDKDGKKKMRVTYCIRI